MIAWGSALALGAWPALDGAMAAQGGGEHDAAVVIAIEDYAYVQDVPGAAANGAAWVRWLRDGRGVPAVRSLRDGQANRETIVEAVAAAAARVEPGGTLWIVFVGHGAPGGMLVGADAQGTASGLRHRSVARDDLLTADHPTVMVLDACFSGRTPAGDVLAPGLQPMVPTWATAPAQATLLLASATDQVAGPLPGGNRPAFSYLVLGALQGWGDGDGDGRITASEAVDYAGGVLFEAAPDRVQEPQLAGADRILSTGRAAAPRLSTVLRAPRPAPKPAPVARPAPAVHSAPAPVRIVEVPTIVEVDRIVEVPVYIPEKRKALPLMKLPKIRLKPRRDRAVQPADPAAGWVVTSVVGVLALVLAWLGFRLAR